MNKQNFGYTVLSALVINISLGLSIAQAQIYNDNQNMNVNTNNNMNGTRVNLGGVKIIAGYGKENNNSNGYSNGYSSGPGYNTSNNLNNGYSNTNQNTVSGINTNNNGNKNVTSNINASTNPNLNGQNSQSLNSGGGNMAEPTAADINLAQGKVQQQETLKFIKEMNVDAQKELNAIGGGNADIKNNEVKISGSKTNTNKAPRAQSKISNGPNVQKVDITAFNKDTLNEFTAIGQQKLSQEYAKFRSDTANMKTPVKIIRP